MRLPVIAPADLTAEQRPVYDDWHSGISSFLGGFTTERADGGLIGPFNAFVHFPDLGEVIYGMFAAVNTNPTLPPLVREVVILRTGAWLNCLFELYSHEAVAAKKGMSATKIASLAAGQRPLDLTDDEAIAYDVVSNLLRGAPLPNSVYALAVERLGERGVAEIAALSGTYVTVTNMLLAFDVQMPQTEGA